jgi:hypothetical protein
MTDHTDPVALPQRSIRELLTDSACYTLEGFVEHAKHLVRLGFSRSVVRDALATTDPERCGVHDSLRKTNLKVGPILSLSTKLARSVPLATYAGVASR